MGDAADDAERRADREREEEGMSEPTTIDGAATEVEEEVRHLPAVQAHEAMIAKAEISVEELVAQADKIKQVMDAAMTKGIHYGQIPGIQKPTLLKPGAEKLNVVLRLKPSYKSERIFHDNGHLTVVSLCTLTHIQSGLEIAEGEGLCSTYESKYAYRGEGRTCPACGAAGTIKKSKYAPRAGDYPGATINDPPGWYCHAKVGGCGANFAATDERIVEQTGERVENPNLPDTWNTVLKMADKRALVAAVLNGTAASDVFTQDAEDSSPGSVGAESGTTGADAGTSAAGGEPTAAGDPGLVLPEGFKGEGVPQRIGETLEAVDSTVDWKATWDAAILALHGKPRAKLNGPDVEGAWTRLAVVADRLHGYTQTLPPQDSVIAEAFAYAFQGVQVAVVQKPQHVSGASTESPASAEASDEGAAPPEAQNGGEAALSDEQQALIAQQQADDDIPF